MQVILLYTNAMNPTEYSRKISRTANFANSVSLGNGVFEISLQMNISSYYQVDVKYLSQRIQNLNAQVTWFYVDVNPDTGVTKD
jgi:DNA integrity scanning protein DisA with diadenylate cyclase activity